MTAELPASEEAPVYRKLHQDGTTNFWMITCDEGWRSSILCTDMHEADADWLLLVLGRKPRGVTP